MAFMALCYTSLIFSIVVLFLYGMKKIFDIEPEFFILLVIVIAVTICDLIAIHHMLIFFLT